MLVEQTAKGFEIWRSIIDQRESEVLKDKEDGILCRNRSTDPIPEDNDDDHDYDNNNNTSIIVQVNVSFLRMNFVTY